MKISKRQILSLIITIIIVSVGFFHLLRKRTHLTDEYNQALMLMDDGEYTTAIEKFEQLGNYKDSFFYINEAQERLVAFNEAEKSAEIIALYERAVGLFDDEKYEEAIKILEELGDNLSVISDGADMLKESKYQLAKKLLSAREYVDSSNMFAELADYRDSQMLLYTALLHFVPEVQNQKYNEAMTLMKANKYNLALEIFELLISYDYEPAIQKAEECRLILRRMQLANTISAAPHAVAAIDGDGGILIVSENEDKFSSEFNSEWNNIISIAANQNRIVGLYLDGTVIATDRPMSTSARSEAKWVDLNVTSLSNIIQIAAGYDFILALDTDGHIHFGGENVNGVNEVSNWDDIIEIAAGSEFAAGLSKYGTVYTTNDSINKQISANIEEWSDIIHISAGGGTPINGYSTGHIVGIRKDGMVVAVGQNSLGQCDVENWIDIEKISAGLFHTVAIDTSGKVFSVGGNTREDFANHNNEIKQWNDIDVEQISAGWGFTVCVNRSGKAKMIGYPNGAVLGVVESWTNILIHED